MSDFVNTCDVIGDKALTDSIIDRSVTEYRDDVVTRIGTNAFNGCTKLQTVDCPSVTYIEGNPFANCNSIEYVGLDGIGAYSTQLFSSASRKLKEIRLSSATHFAASFSRYSALESVIVPKARQVYKNAFQNCSSLKNVDFSAAESVGEYAFQNCAKLTECDFPELTTIGQYGFAGCTSLTNINLPKVSNINGLGLAGCSVLTKVVFPSVTTLGICIFQNCPAIETADFHKPVSFGSAVFDGCAKFKQLILRGDTLSSLSDSQVLANTPISNKADGYIYVPRALIDSYKAATNWSNHATQFRALEDYTVDGTTTGELDPTKI